MPDLTAKEAGDNFYPQYNRITTEPVSNIAVAKGKLYTKGTGSVDANQLVAPTNAGFLNGIYQAMVSVPQGSKGEHKVQCFGPGSRIGIPAKLDNMHAGQLVKYDNGEVTLFTGSANISLNEYNSKIGRIFEIYSKDDITTKKDVTKVGDIVIVELGQG